MHPKQIPAWPTTGPMAQWIRHEPGIVGSSPTGVISLLGIEPATLCLRGLLRAAGLLAAVMNNQSCQTFCFCFGLFWSLWFVLACWFVLVVLVCFGLFGVFGFLFWFLLVCSGVFCFGLFGFALVSFGFFFWFLLVVLFWLFWLHGSFWFGLFGLFCFFGLFWLVWFALASLIFSVCLGFF